MHTTELLERGRQAFDLAAWPDAYERLARVDRITDLDPVDLERLATSAYLTGRDADSADAWGRAHQAWRAVGDLGRAVRCAFWLGFGLIQRGAVAQGGGWLARADRLVEDHDLDTVDRGYLLVSAGLRAMAGGRHDSAMDRFGEADELARRFGDHDLAALGLISRGAALLRLGRTTDGLRLMDEAMVSVTSGEISPTVAGLVYCAVINYCQQIHDLRRAEEWTEALDRWCHEQPGLVPYRGQCLVHRAQVFQLRGEWRTALAEAERARRWLTDPPHPAVGMAHYQVGELHRLRGELGAADTAYDHAQLAGRDPQPGRALTRLAQGRTEGAVAAITVALDASHDKVTRLQLLPAMVEILLAVGRHEDAAAAAEELDVLAEDGPVMLQAEAARTRGTLLLAEGDATGALVHLHQSLVLWQELHVPYEIAQVRARLAEGFMEVDDPDSAELEFDAACRVFDVLGAVPARDRLDLAMASRTRPVQPPSQAHDPAVTDREMDVLRLVAAGRKNRQIGVELMISEKTVERHLANLFTKFGVANRAAATAHAYEHGLLRHE